LAVPTASPDCQFRLKSPLCESHRRHATCPARQCRALGYKSRAGVASPRAAERDKPCSGSHRAQN